MSNRHAHPMLMMLMAWVMAIAPASVAKPARATAVQRLAELETRGGGRIGLAALDTGTGRRLEHRADERFALCSTFKLIFAGAVLARVDANKESLDRQVPFKSSDLLGHSPATKRHLLFGVKAARPATG